MHYNYIHKEFIITNNDPEWFTWLHNLINTRNNKNMNMYRLINTLYEESMLVDTISRVALAIMHVVRRQWKKAL